MKEEALKFEKKIVGCIHLMYNDGSMKRTQIYLPEQLLIRLNALKAKKNLSVAEIIRQILIKHLGEEEANVSENLADLADLDITGGPKDLSQNFDSYLAKR